MRWRQALRALVKWVSTLLAAGALALLIVSHLGRLTWDAETVHSSVGLLRGVVLVAWASPGTVEREVCRIMALPSFPQDESGARILETYRRQLQDNAAVGAREEASSFDPGRARGVNRSWLWLGGTCRTNNAGIGAFAFPLWPLLIGPLPVAWMLWRPDLQAWREAQRTRCRKCGYDRRGLASDAKCPECGAVPPPTN